LFQGVAAPVGLLGLVANDMGERGLGNFARKMRLVPRPIPKGRTETVNRRTINLQSAHYFGHRHMRQWLSAARARKNVIATYSSRRVFEQRDPARCSGGGAA